MKEVGFLFPGQGSQHIGMGKDLYDTYPHARQVFDQANKAYGYDLASICFEGPQEKLTQTRFAQPAIFVVSMAALAVFKSMPKSEEYHPKYYAGLSLGEATALCAAGAFNFDEGVRFVRNRGQYMDEASVTEPGSMAAVLGLDLAEVEKICAESGAEIGNLNCPGQVVISGKKAGMEKAIEKLHQAGARKVIPLDVSGGFHSSCMQSACTKIEAALKMVTLQAPTAPVVSNLTALPETDPAKIRQNLIFQMNHRTLWEASMRYLIGQGIKTFIEFAPGKVLKGLTKKIDPSIQVISMNGVEDFQTLN